jgi:serpin B
LAGGDAVFGGRLYDAVAPGQQSFALSPFSVSQALAMTSAGARGATLTGLRQAVGWQVPEDRLHAAAQTLDAELGQANGAGVRLEIANSLWAQTGLRFESPFLDTLARYYGAGVELVDYEKAPDAARGAINGWVEQRTHGKIPQLLAPGVIATDSRLVLVNAVYLHADWEQPFDRSATSPGPFHSPDGVHTAQFMKRTDDYAYARGSGYQAVELPYKGGRLAMDVILPDAGRLPEIARRVGQASGLGQLLGGLQSTRVALSLPKVKLSSQFELRPALAALGAGDLFTDGADLLGMTAEERLKISAVIHKVKLTVDEKGTEAAAATGVVAIATAARPERSIPLTIDRPFLLAIRDKATRELLFYGRVLSP